MSTSTWYRATDRCVYDGCPSSDLRKELNSISRLRDRALDRGGFCCYFPREGQYQVWVGNCQVTNMYEHEGDALVAFLEQER